MMRDKAHIDIDEVVNAFVLSALQEETDGVLQDMLVDGTSALTVEKHAARRVLAQLLSCDGVVQLYRILKSDHGNNYESFL